MSGLEIVNAETLLTTEDEARLEAAEHVIADGLGAFIDVGRALLEIRENGLYRAYGTFDDYCGERWNLRKRRAYQLCDESEMAQSLMDSGIEPVHLPETEFIARMLVPVWREHPDQLADTWRGLIAEAEASGKPLSGTVVERYVRREHRDLFKAGATYGRPAPMIELLSVLDDYLAIATKLRQFAARNPGYQPPERVAARFAARGGLAVILGGIVADIGNGGPVPPAEEIRALIDEGAQ